MNFTMLVQMQGLNRFRWQVPVDAIDSRPFPLFVITTNGEVTWTNLAKKAEKGGARGTELGEFNYLNWVCSLFPLVEEDYDLEFVDEPDVGQDRTYRIRAAKKGEVTVDLYFRQKDYLLVKADYESHASTRVASAPPKIELVMSDFKFFDGVRLPAKLAFFVDREELAVWQIIGAKYSKDLPESVFTPPSPGGEE